MDSSTVNTKPNQNIPLTNLASSINDRAFFQLFDSSFKHFLMGKNFSTLDWFPLPSFQLSAKEPHLFPRTMTETASYHISDSALFSTALCHSTYVPIPPPSVLSICLKIKDCLLNTNDVNQKMNLTNVRNIIMEQFFRIKSSPILLEAAREKLPISWNIKNEPAMETLEHQEQLIAIDDETDIEQIKRESPLNLTQKSFWNNEVMRKTRYWLDATSFVGVGKSKREGFPLCQSPMLSQMPLLPQHLLYDGRKRPKATIRSQILLKNGYSLNNGERLQGRLNVGLSVPQKPTQRSQPQLPDARRPYTEAELASAVRAICFGQLGTRRAASVFGIPRSTLRNKICKLNELKRKEEEAQGGGRCISLAEFVQQVTSSSAAAESSCVQYNSRRLNHSCIPSRIASVFKVNCRRSNAEKQLQQQQLALHPSKTATPPVTCRAIDATASKTWNPKRQHSVIHRFK